MWTEEASLPPSGPAATRKVRRRAHPRPQPRQSSVHSVGSALAAAPRSRPSPALAVGLALAAEPGVQHTRGQTCQAAVRALPATARSRGDGQLPLRAHTSPLRIPRKTLFDWCSGASVCLCCPRFSGNVPIGRSGFRFAGSVEHRADRGAVVHGVAGPASDCCVLGDDDAFGIVAREEIGPTAVKNIVSERRLIRLETSARRSAGGIERVFRPTLRGSPFSSSMIESTLASQEKRRAVSTAMAGPSSCSQRPAQPSRRVWAST